MFDFYMALLQRLKVIENHNMTLQTILFNLTRIVLNHKKRARLNSTLILAGESPGSKAKIYTIYKPPLNEIPEISDDDERRVRPSAKKRRQQEMASSNNGGHKTLKMSKKTI